MTNKQKGISVSKLVLIIAPLLTLVGTVAAQEPNSPYDLIKSVEGDFPLPPPPATVEVGTFDAATGQFMGLKTYTFRDPHGRLIIVTPKVKIDAVYAKLRFKVTNRQGDFVVRVGGLTKSAPSGQDSVTFDVGTAKNVRWTVRSGDKSFSDTLVINRPRVVAPAAGAFEASVIPVAIIYEPTPDRQNKNKANYAVTKSIGSTVRISFSQDTRTTQPKFNTFFRSLTDLRSKTDKLATIIAASPDPDAQATAKAMKSITTAIGLALGEAKASLTRGDSFTQYGGWALSSLVEHAHTTGENDGGPGIGDQIVFLRNVKFVWLVEDGKVSLSVLDYDRVASRKVGILKTQTGPDPGGLDRETIQDLLNLDPFVAGGAQAPLPEPRFTKVEELEINGDQYLTFSFQEKETDAKATVGFTTKTNELHKGILGFIGLGIPETRTVKTTVTHGRTTEEIETKKVEVSVDFYAEFDELYAIAIYYDRVFRTFAFKEVALHLEPLLSGTALDSNGQPLPKKLVTLMIGNEKFSTHTDEQGHYALHSSNIKAGKGALIIGNKRQPIDFRGVPIRNLILRQPE